MDGMDFMDKYGQEWTIWTNMDKYGQIWTNMDKYGQIWTNMDERRFGLRGAL